MLRLWKLRKPKHSSLPKAPQRGPETSQPRLPRVASGVLVLVLVLALALALALALVLNPRPGLRPEVAALQLVVAPTHRVNMQDGQATGRPTRTVAP